MTIAPPLQTGQRIGHDAGNARITVIRTERDIYVLQTLIGTSEQPDWSWRYDDEHTARAEARRVAVAFHRYRTDVAIAARRHELEFQVRDLLNSRRPGATALLDQVGAELDAIATLADAANLRAARAQAAVRCGLAA